MAGILEVAEVWSSGLAELGPAQPQLVFVISRHIALTLLGGEGVEGLGP